MRTSKFHFFILCCIAIFSGCAPLRPPTVIRNATVTDYKYAYISPTKELTSSVSVAYGSEYSMYSSATTKSVNPSDVIAGILIKEGFIILSEPNPSLADETVIVNYGESGRRSLNFGYTIEVTIQFISAKYNEIVCSCTAEGQGTTEADDVNQAIRRALSELFVE